MSMQPLRITYQPWGETLAELADAGRRAEQAGASGLWANEMHRSGPGTIAALAASTDRIRLGTSIMLGFVRSPMITAMEAMDLQEISNERFALGLGTGVKRLNEEWHGVRFGKAMPHMRETVRNIREFWATCATEQDVDLPGEYEPMRIRGYQRPYPVPSQRIPIYLAAVGPLMTRLTGEIADGWISHELCSPEFVRAKVRPGLAEGCARSGRSLEDMDTVASVCCSIDSDPAVARWRAAGMLGFYATVRTYSEFFSFHGLAAEQERVIAAFQEGGASATGLADAVAESMVETLTAAGTRDRVAAKIDAYRGVVTSVKLSPPTYGLDADEVRAAQDAIIDLIEDL